MDKNVGSVDIEELKLARQALDKERGIESDPNMYSNYNPNRQKEEDSAEVSTEINDEMFENSQNLEEQMISNANESGMSSDETQESVYQEESSSIQENSEDVQEENENLEVFENEINEDNDTPNVFLENSVTGNDSNLEEEGSEENKTAVEEINTDDDSDDIDFSVYDSFADFEVEANRNIIAEESSTSNNIEEELDTQDNEESDNSNYETSENTDEEVEEPETSETEEIENDIESELIASLENALNIESNSSENEEESTDTETQEEQIVEEENDSTLDDVQDEYQEESDAKDEEIDLESELIDSLENALNIGSNSSENEEESTDTETQEEKTVEEENDNTVEDIQEEYQEEIESFESEESEEDTQEHVENDSNGELDEIARLEAQIAELQEKLKESETAEKAQEESDISEHYNTDEEDDYDAINSLMESLEGLKPIDLTEDEKREIDEKRRASEERRKDEELQIIDDFKKLQRLDRILNEDIEEEHQEVIIEEKPKVLYPEIEEVNFVDIISTEEFKSTDNLSYILGKDEEGKIHYGNLRDLYNMVIYSKDNNSALSAVHSILVSLILKNSTSDINFVICDSKADSKLQIYNKSSYMYFNRLAKTNKEILDTLIEISKELEERYKILAAAGVKSIEQYNIIAKNDNLSQLPYIVTVFNNYTKSMQLADADKINTILYQILKLGRIVGLYLIAVGNMKIKSDDINYNLPTRLSFKVPDEEDSLSMFGESGAELLVADDEFVLFTLDTQSQVHLKVPSVTAKELEILIKNIEI